MTLHRSNLFQPCKTYLVLIVLLLGTTQSASANAKKLNQHTSEAKILDKAGAPSIKFKNSNDKCKEKCRKTLRLGARRFTFKHKAELKYSTRYRDVTWAVIQVARKKEVSYQLVSNRSSRKIKLKTDCKSSAIGNISVNGQLVCLEDDKVSVITANEVRRFDLPSHSVAGVLGHNINGRMTIAYIDDSKYDLHFITLRKLLTQPADVGPLPKTEQSNSDNTTNNWVTTNTQVHSRSDFKDIIAVSPLNSNMDVVAVYEYINVYNKGLTLYYFGDEQLKNSGQLVHDENENFGFSPNITIVKDKIIVSARNSSTSQTYSYQLLPSDLENITQPNRRFETASVFDFMAGAGIQQTYWHVDQAIKTDDTTHAKTDYNMNQNLMQSYFMQGRWGNTQLAINYLTNKAEDAINEQSSSVIEKYATEKLLAQLDFNQFFTGASTLRLAYESLDAGGIATYSDDLNQSQTYQFNTTLDSYSLLVISERGIYYGGNYSSLDAPSAVGFLNNNKRYIGSSFDKEFAIDRYTVVIGYDEAAYGARYETNYSGLYFSGELGIGLAHLNVSKTSLYEATAKTDLSIEGQNAMIINGELELGYTYQRRSKSLRGLGFSLQLGYRTNFSYIDQNWKDNEDEFDSDQVLLIYERTDVLHGPFAEINVIF